MLFFPSIGLILYLIWQDNKPIESKGAVKLALWEFGTGGLAPPPADY